LDNGKYFDDNFVNPFEKEYFKKELKIDRSNKKYKMMVNQLNQETFEENENVDDF